MGFHFPWLVRLKCRNICKGKNYLKEGCGHLFIIIVEFYCGNFTNAMSYFGTHKTTVGRDKNKKKK